MSSERFPTKGDKGTTGGSGPQDLATRLRGDVAKQQAPVPAITKLRFVVDRAKQTGWFAGMKVAVRRFLYVAALVGIWIGLCQFEMLEIPVKGAGTLCISAVLFALAMPCSIFLRMDQMLSDRSISMVPEMLLLVALPMVLLNFLLFGVVRGALRGKKRT